MSYLNNQELIGKVLSIIGLSLAPLATLFARHYSRSLYFAQMLFVWSILYNTTGSISFSSYLGWSWLGFMPEFTSKWCTIGDYSCSYGNLVSPGIVWLGGVVLFFIVIKIVACKKKEAKFLSFYNFYKGFLYWFFAPLVYYSTNIVVNGIQASNMGNNFIAAVIVLGIFVGISIVEVIAYKIAQREEENIWKKWIQFLSHYMVAGVMVCAVLSLTSSQVIKYIANVPLALFSIIYLIKYKFAHKVIQRIFMFIQDAIIITLLNIYILKPSYVIDYLLDFYGLIIVIIIEFIILVVKFVIFCKRGDEDEDERGVVSPEKDGRQHNKEKKLTNSFGQMQNLAGEGSFEGLGSSGVKATGSPKRGGPPPRRR